MAETKVKVAKFEVASSGTLKIEQIGAGVGVVLFRPVSKVGAGIHILAPHTDSKGSNPFMYANTAIPQALEELGKQGVNAGLSVAIAGGASMMGQDDSSGVGPKIVNAVKEALKKAGLVPKLDDTGGRKIRTITVDIGSGHIEITTKPMEKTAIL